MNRLCIRTREQADGRIHETWLLQDGPHLAVTDEPEEEGGEGRLLPLTTAAIVAVFDRYGKPIDIDLPPLEADDAAVFVQFEDGSTGTMRAFEYRAPVDVMANDYLVLERDGSEPLAGPAPLLAPALLSLARSTAKKLGQN